VKHQFLLDLSDEYESVCQILKSQDAKMREIIIRLIKIKLWLREFNNIIKNELAIWSKNWMKIVRYYNCQKTDHIVKYCSHNNKNSDDESKNEKSKRKLEKKEHEEIYVSCKRAVYQWQWECLEIWDLWFEICDWDLWFEIESSQSLTIVITDIEIWEQEEAWELVSLWDRCSFAWVAIEQEKVLNLAVWRTDWLSCWCLEIQLYMTQNLVIIKQLPDVWVRRNTFICMRIVYIVRSNFQ